MTNKTFGVALIEKPLDEGINITDAIELFHKLHGVEAIPIEIEAEFSSAMGWINLTDAEILNYDTSNLKEFIRYILEDMERETTTGEYTYDNGNEIEILIIR